jgi:hypothetical protein
MAKRRRKRGRPFTRTIRRGYRGLSLLNTVSWILTGDIGKIVKHFMRKRAHSKLGGWMR